MRSGKGKRQGAWKEPPTGDLLLNNQELAGGVCRTNVSFLVLSCPSGN